MMDFKIEDAKTNGNDKTEMGQDDAVSAPESFWKSMDDDTKTLVEKEYDEAKKCASRKKWSKADQAMIETATLEDLEARMERERNQATHHQAGFKKKASHGARAERGIMKFLDDFSAYVQAYKGVVDVMKGAGFGQGEAAYGALQLLVITAVHKQRTEDFIEKMLVELGQQYDRLKRLKAAYPTAEMQKYTAVLYRLGVEFLHESVRYYRMSPFRRFGHLIARPPSIGVQRIVEDIKSAIRETEREMRAIDGGRIDRIGGTQLQMALRQKEDRRMLEETNTLVNSLQIRSDNDRLDILRRLLHLDASNEGLGLERYEESLRETFHYPAKLPPLNVKGQVFYRPEFEKWKNGTASSIFFLHGATVAPHQTTYSWLSPAAVQLVSTLGTVFVDGENMGPSALLSHYIPQPRDVVSSTPEKTSPIIVFSSIIHQVLRSERGKLVIRNEESFAFLKQSIDALESKSTKQINAKCRGLNTILSKTLEELNVARLVIVIDRIDKLQLGMENAMELLVDLMQRAKVTLKIFVTARSRAVFDDEDVKERLGEQQYTRVTVNQDD